MSDENRKARALRWTALAWLGFATPMSASEGRLPSPGCLDGGQPARVTAIGPDLDLVLDDGRDIRLPGIDPSDSGGEEPTAPARSSDEARGALARWLVGRSVSVAALQAEPDRWGRVVALTFAAGPDASPRDGSAPSPRVSIVEAILDAGFARARPDPLIQSCWPVFLDEEERARLRGAGLWRHGANAVVVPGDEPGLKRRIGTMAIVEGRILRVGVGRSRLYLSFANGFGFVVTIPRFVQARLHQTGIVPETWKGRQVRVRGFLDDRFGFRIELTSLDQIEFIQP